MPASSSTHGERLHSWPQPIGSSFLIREISCTSTQRCRNAMYVLAGAPEVGIIGWGAGNKVYQTAGAGTRHGSVRTRHTRSSLKLRALEPVLASYQLGGSVQHGPEGSAELGIGRTVQVAQEILNLLPQCPSPPESNAKRALSHAC